MLMNGHCSKDTKQAMSTHTTMENIFVLIFVFVSGVCTFDGIAEHEGRKAELPMCDLYLLLRKCLFFLFVFNLFLFNDLINKC